MMDARVTILLPNYRTLLLTKLCLRLLRKFTDPQLCKVIVIDNDSQDESLTYLRGLSWIELLERPAIPGEPVALAHSRALDLGLAHVSTPYVLSLHTDSFVKQPTWLPFLLSHIEQDPNCAGVGSWKLEQKPWWKGVIKQLENRWQRWRGTHAKHEGIGDNHLYLRSHCALYRTELLKQHQLTFSLHEEVAGKAMHRHLCQLGYTMKFLETESLWPYLDHINHATMILNPQLGARAKTVRQGLKKISKQLAKVDCQAILQDERLDL